MPLLNDVRCAQAETKVSELGMQKIKFEQALEASRTKHQELSKQANSSQVCPPPARLRC